jgi:hypothetical protein
MGPESGGEEVACQSQLGGVITTGGGFSTYYAAPDWQTDAVAGYFHTFQSADGAETGIGIDSASRRSKSSDKVEKGKPASAIKGGKVIAAAAEAVPSSGYNPRGRAYPDVSLIGVEYQAFVDKQPVALFGTSAAAPVLGGMVSRLNADRLARNLTSIGFLNPTLWKYGVNNSFGVGGAFLYPYHDVISGHTKCMAYSGANPSTQAPCCESGFYATPGWDPASGFGSVSYPMLQQMFDSQVPYDFPDTDDFSEVLGQSLGMLVQAVAVGLLALLAMICAGYYAKYAYPYKPPSAASDGAAAVPASSMEAAAATSPFFDSAERRAIHGSSIRSTKSTGSDGSDQGDGRGGGGYLAVSVGESSSAQRVSAPGSLPASSTAIAVSGYGHEGGIAMTSIGTPSSSVVGGSNSNNNSNNNNRLSRSIFGVSGARGSSSNSRSTGSSKSSSHARGVYMPLVSPPNNDGDFSST